MLKEFQSVLLGITKDSLISLLSNDPLNMKMTRRDIAGKFHFRSYTIMVKPLARSCMIFKTSPIHLGPGRKLVHQRGWHQDPWKAGTRDSNPLFLASWKVVSGRAAQYWDPIDPFFKVFFGNFFCAHDHAWGCCLCNDRIFPRHGKFSKD